MDFLLEPLASLYFLDSELASHDSSNGPFPNTRVVIIAIAKSPQSE